MKRSPRTFREFWPYYLREHARPRTRALHYIGTTLLFIFGLLGLVTGWAWLFWFMPIAGYAFAWIAHFTVERNRPATFRFPLWSLYADFRMWAYWVTGRMPAELRRAGIVE